MAQFPYDGAPKPRYPDNCSAVTKSDSTTYSPPVTVYVGTSGDVAIIPAGNPTGAAVTFKNVPAGATLPVRAYKVMSTNTTASDMVGIVD